MLLDEQTESYLKYMETPRPEIPLNRTTWTQTVSHVKVGLLNLIVRK